VTSKKTRKNDPRTCGMAAIFRLQDMVSMHRAKDKTKDELTPELVMDMMKVAHGIMDVCEQAVACLDSAPENDDIEATDLSLAESQ
jgi:hypothetical protein